VGYFKREAKVDVAYYRDVLRQQMLPGIPQLAGDVYVFQQGNAPAHHALDTVELLRRDTIIYSA